MKKINKRTMAWGILTVGVLAAAAFSDDLAFVDVDSEKVVTAEVKSELKEDVFTLSLKDKSNTYGVFTAGAGDLFSEEESVLVIDADKGRAGVAVLEAINTPVVTSVQPKEVTEEAVSAEAASMWDSKALAVVESQANVRAEASEESEIVGKIRNGDGADVIEKGAEWTLITSGNVKGYVKNEFLVYAEEAESLANQLGKKVATVQADGLNIREQASETANVVDQAFSGKDYVCISEDAEWVGIALAADKAGYVKAEFVTVEYKLGSAITLEEEQAMIKAEQEAAERAAKEKAEQEAAAAKKAAEKKAAQEKAQTVTKTQTAATQATVDDLTLMAAVIEMEAGTSYDGGIAVGNVILNRVNSSSFPNSISGVIYQRGQFPGAHNGKLSRILSRGPKSECVAAAQAALNGENIVGGRLYFNSQGAVNYNRISDYVIVGGNCFY